MSDSKEQISLNDLMIIKSIISVASRRGGFIAEEFEDIGKLFTKLDTFLKKHVDKKINEEIDTEITINDLISLKNIINIASQRGAFAAEEFEEIGKVFTKLDNFLKIQTKILEEANKVNEDEIKEI
jgi:hypothetical protein